MDGFDKQGLAIGFHFIELAQAFAEWSDKTGDDQADGCGEREHQQGQPPAIQREQWQEDYQRKSIEQRQEKAAGQKIADAACLLHVLDEDTCRTLLEEADRQGQQVLEGLGGDADVGSVGGKE